MKISVIDLTNKEVEDSSTELIDKLQSNSFKWDYDQSSYYAQKILKMLSCKSYDSVIDQINKLSQEDVIFIEGDIYNFSFIYPSNIYNNKKIKTIINKTVKISGIALPVDKILSKDEEGYFNYLDQTYQIYQAKDENDLLGLIHSLTNERYFYNSYIPLKRDISITDIVFKPLYKYPKEYNIFGYGEINDIFTAKNLSIKNEEDAKAFEIKAFNEPIQYFKNKLIEVIYFKITNKRVSYNQIPNPEKIYDEYITKKLDNLKVEYSIPEENYHLDLADMNKKFYFGESENKSLNKDIYFKAKDLVKFIFKTDNQSFIQESIRVADIIIRKVLLSKEQYKTEESEANNAQFELLKYIYIIGSLHKIQHTLNIKVTEGKTVDFFLKILFDKAKTYVDASNLSQSKIEEAYWNALIKIDQVLNDSNIIVIQKEEREYVSSFDQYKRIVGLIRSQEPIKNNTYEYSEDDIYKSILNKTNSQDFQYYRNIRRYKPSLLSINRTYKTAFAKISLNQIKVNSDFESFEINKFYEYYTNGCPKSSIHEWVNDKCKYCFVTQDMIKNKDPKYYNLNKKDFINHRQKVDLILLKKPTISFTNDLPDIKPQYLKGKIDEIISKYREDKIVLLNLTRNEGIPIGIAKTKLIEGPIYKYNLHRMKYYLSFYGVDVDILNNQKNNEDLFISMFYTLVNKLDKEGLKELLKYDLLYAKQEIEDLLAKKKATIKTDSSDYDPNLEYEEDEKGDEEEGIDFEYDEDQDQPDI